ncbi:unnamed protein product, partial [Prorocentrum cordatum]
MAPPRRGYVACPHAACRYQWNWRNHSKCWKCGGNLKPSPNDTGGKGKSKGRWDNGTPLSATSPFASWGAGAAWAQDGQCTTAATALDGPSPFAPTPEQPLGALERRLPPEAAGDMGAHLSAFAAALQTPSPDKDKKHKVQKPRPELEREQELHQSAVAARKAQEALDKAIIFEEECKEWLQKAPMDLQQKVQAAAATAVAHQRLLRSSLEAQPPPPLQPTAINPTAILETTEPEELGKLVCFEDGDLFSPGDLELEQEEIEQWNRHKSELAAEVSKLIVAAVGPSSQGLAQRWQAFADYRARMAHKRRRTAAGAAPEQTPPEPSPENIAKTLAEARARREASK